MLASLCSLALTLGVGALTPLAVYPLQPRGVEPAVAQSVDGVVRQQIETLGRYKLYGLGDTQGVLKPSAGALGLSCDDGKPDCLASVGRLLSADMIVFGTVSPQSTELVLVDAKTSGELRRVAIAGPPASASHEAVIALLIPDTYLGSVTIVGDRGQVAIDGVGRGALPISTPLTLPVGRHTVTVSLDGGPSWDVACDVRYQEVTSVDARPNPGLVVTPVDMRPRFWATAALTAAVVTAATGIVCGAVAQDNDDALKGMTRPIAQSDRGTLDQRAQRGPAFGIAADALWTTAAVLGVAGIVLYLVAVPASPNASARAEVVGDGAVVRF